MGNQLEALLPLNARLDIDHLGSHESAGLQAVDLFCWGIARKDGLGDKEWYEVYEEKVIFTTNLFAGKWAIKMTAPCSARFPRLIANRWKECRRYWYRSPMGSASHLLLKHKRASKDFRSRRETLIYSSHRRDPVPIFSSCASSRLRLGDVDYKTNSIAECLVLSAESCPL